MSFCYARRMDFFLLDSRMLEAGMEGLLARAARRVAAAYRVHNAARHGSLSPAAAAQALRQAVVEGTLGHARLLGVLRAGGG